AGIRADLVTGVQTCALPILDGDGRDGDGRDGDGLAGDGLDGDGRDGDGRAGTGRDGTGRAGVDMEGARDHPDRAGARPGQPDGRSEGRRVGTDGRGRGTPWP